MIVFVQNYFPFDDAFSYDGAGVSGRKELTFSAIYLENDWIFPAVFPKTADFFFLGGGLFTLHLRIFQRI